MGPLAAILIGMALAPFRDLTWLDLWGNGVAARADSRHVISDLGRLIAVRLASPAEAPGPAPG